MCRAFPQIRVVGVDPFDAALAIARENIAREGLAERIELRRSSVEELRDVEDLLRGAQLSSVQTLVGPPWAPARVIGQRG
jgi:predicted O-methyltransferase YrrM